MLLLLRVLFTLFSALTVAFIFGNSMQIADASSLRSGSLVGHINALLERLPFSYRVTEHLVRKLAHFAEYALLGFWLMLSLRVYTKRIVSHMSTPLFLGLLTAVCDESLQLLFYGRSPEFSDVWLDFFGIAAGIVCGLFVLLLVRMCTVLYRSKTPL